MKSVPPTSRNLSPPPQILINNQQPVNVLPATIQSTQNIVQSPIMGPIVNRVNTFQTQQNQQILMNKSITINKQPIITDRQNIHLQSPPPSVQILQPPQPQVVTRQISPVRNTIIKQEHPIVLSPVRQQQVIQNPIVNTNTITTTVQNLQPAVRSTIIENKKIEQTTPVQIMQQKEIIKEKPVYYENQVEKIVEKPVYYEKIVEKPVYIDNPDKGQQQDDSQYKNKITILERENLDLHNRLEEYRSQNLQLNSTLESYKTQIFTLQNSPARIETIETIVEKPVFHERIQQVEKPSEKVIYVDNKEELLQVQSDYQQLQSKYQNLNNQFTTVQQELTQVKSNNQYVRELENRVADLSMQLEGKVNQSSAQVSTHLSQFNNSNQGFDYQQSEAERVKRSPLQYKEIITHTHTGNNGASYLQ